ncbi:hypothetical protein [Azospirillum sp. B506]|uniref:hypothetical protein n=1 Tax=Azospirillum sp. B506 TaxID=137721 RepID=UPI0005B268C0|nr:hypothetical protein [Azospirillum sp. B506]
MPDTHLVMPCTLSAPYAELLEAEAPQTMTASDAPPDGTAAAAAAFARLLASGDHAMQPERFTITETLANHCPHGGEDLHRPHALRAVLLGTTTIPSIGITFQEAAEQYAGMIAEHDAIHDDGDDNRRQELAGRWVAIENAIAAAEKHTVGDCLAALKVFAHRASPLHDGDFQSPNVNGEAVFAAMLQTVAKLVTLHDTESDGAERSDDPAVAAYVAWVSALAAETRASDEIGDLTKRLDREYPDVKAKFEEYEQARVAREEAEEAVVEAAAATPLGALARFAYFTYWTSGCMYEGDIKLWQSAVSDISRLGVLPLPAEVRAFGEGRFFGPLHRAAMSKEGIDPSGRSIALPSSLWEPAPEHVSVIYDLPASVAKRMAVECDRNRARSAADPGGPEQKARVTATFGRMSQDQQEFFIEWLEFFATGSHLHAATLEFTKEQGHGLLSQYRDQLLDDLRDVEALLPHEDVKQPQPLWGEVGPSTVGDGHPDADILALGRRRSELIDQIDQPGRSDDEIMPLRIEWKEVDHLIMELQPKTGAGLAVQLATVWYQLEPEPGGEHCPKADSPLDRVWLWTAMKNAERIGGTSQPAPDRKDGSEISNAFDALLDAMKAESALPEDMSDGDREPYENKMMAAADHLADLAPKTFCDAAILLRYLILRVCCDTLESEQAFLRGAEPSEADLVDFRARILWWVVKMLEASPAAANDQHQNADAFADTVAAFETEAPATLALPLEPTGRMVDAGASAAGITPAQFQAAYAAAVEALKLERAA